MYLYTTRRLIKQFVVLAGIEDCLEKECQLSVHPQTLQGMPEFRCGLASLLIHLVTRF